MPRPAIACPSPDGFAIVMATGIVSIAAAQHHYVRISTGLLILAASVFVVLVAATLAARCAFGDLRDVDVTVRLFTFVAACAVLAARLSWRSEVGWILALAALAAWLALVGLTARNMWHDRRHLRQRSRGAWELASVGTSGLVIVAGELSVRWPILWWIAVVLWMVALVFYALMTVLIVARAAAARFDPTGAEPDSWILMGGLAIATLAGAGLHRHALTANQVMLVASAVTWICAVAWIPILVWFALHRAAVQPGSLSYAGTWWAMVFPLGMFSAATEAVAFETRWSGLHTVSLVFFWVALVAWSIVGVGAVLDRFLHHRVTGIDR
jgi:tellurite resistance protein TehA-like permease